MTPNIYLHICVHICVRASSGNRTEGIASSRDITADDAIPSVRFPDEACI